MRSADTLERGAGAIVNVTRECDFATLGWVRISFVALQVRNSTLTFGIFKVWARLAVAFRLVPSGFTYRVYACRRGASIAQMTQRFVAVQEPRVKWKLGHADRRFRLVSCSRGFDVPSLRPRHRLASFPHHAYGGNVVCFQLHRLSACLFLRQPAMTAL